MNKETRAQAQARAKAAEARAEKWKGRAIKAEKSAASPEANIWKGRTQEAHAEAKAAIEAMNEAQSAEYGAQEEIKELKEIIAAQAEEITGLKASAIRQTACQERAHARNETIIADARAKIQELKERANTTRAAARHNQKAAQEAAEAEAKIASQDNTIQRAIRIANGYRAAAYNAKEQHRQEISQYEGWMRDMHEDMQQAYQNANEVRMQARIDGKNEDTANRMANEWHAMETCETAEAHGIEA